MGFGFLQIGSSGIPLVQSLRKKDTNFGIWWLVLVGNRRQLTSIWLARPIMLEFSLQGPVLDRIWVLTDWVWWKTFSSESEKRGYQLWNMAVGLGWTPREIVQYLARLAYYNARISGARSGTRWDLGSYRLGLVEDLQFKRIPTLEYGGWSWLETAGN